MTERPQPSDDRVAALAEAIERIQSGGARAEDARDRNDQHQNGQHQEDRELEQQARTVVLRKLSAQARTRSELAEALVAKEIPDDVATDVLDRMTEVGLVDDETFAKDWVASRQQRRHLSRRKLADELRKKGVAPDLVDDALTGVADDDEYEAAVTLAQRKLASLSRHDFAVQRRRLAGMLERRGFAPGLIHRVLADVLEPHR